MARWRQSSHSAAWAHGSSTAHARACQHARQGPRAPACGLLPRRPGLGAAGAAGLPQLPGRPGLAAAGAAGLPQLPGPGAAAATGGAGAGTPPLPAGGAGFVAWRGSRRRPQGWRTTRTGLGGVGRGGSAAGAGTAEGGCWRGLCGAGAAAASGFPGTLATGAAAVWDTRTGGGAAASAAALVPLWLPLAASTSLVAAGSCLLADASCWTGRLVAGLRGGCCCGGGGGGGGTPGGDSARSISSSIAVTWCGGMPGAAPLLQKPWPPLLRCRLVIATGIAR